MGYHTKSGRWANTIALHLIASAAYAATFNSNAVELGDRGEARLTLAVTAASGTTPTLDVAVETSPDGTTWTTIGSFTQATGVTSERKIFTSVDRYIRAVATLGGTTPSFTFSVDGEAV